MYIYKVFCACVQLRVFYIKIIYIMYTYVCVCVLYISLYAVYITEQV
jgi:hypothetical protein